MRSSKVWGKVCRFKVVQTDGRLYQKWIFLIVIDENGERMRARSKIWLLGEVVFTA
jgi:hypothetical protein